MKKQNEIEKEQKVEKNFIMSILILCALIIIIFLLIRQFGFIDHKPRIPTGNVDIFDINFKNNCDNCCCNCNGNNNQNTTDNKDDNTVMAPDEETGVTVFDENTKYSYDTPLNIFTNTTYYVVEDKIAPGSENAYQFVIRNHNDFNIKYDIEMQETNNYKINMRYRLKLNNNYVVGNNDSWVIYDELQQINNILAANTYDVYTLEWKWFEGSNDTEVGTNVNSKYKLNIKIMAIGVN